MPSLKRRTLIINLVLVGVVLLGLALAAGAIAGGGPRELAPTTATAERGTVIGTVAAAGEVVSPGDVGVNFAVAGTIVELSVDVGQRVERDEILGHLDDTPYAEQLEVAEAGMRAANAIRAQLHEGAGNELRRLLDVQRSQAELNLRQSEGGLAFAREHHEAALDLLDQQVDNAERQENRAEDFYERVDAEIGCDSVDDDDPDAQRCLQADHRYEDARDAARTARRNRDEARLRADHELQQARERVDSARLALDATRAEIAVQTASPGQGDAAQADAEVVRARVQHAQAERDLDDTVLRSPTSGVIAALNVRVGETVAGPAGGQQSAIVITDTGEREIEAMFSEADAAQLEVGQPASVTFDALPGLSANGHVRRIDPLPTMTGNLVQYGVRIEVDRMPEEVRIGQTSTVEVVAGQADDVVYVPTTALTTVGSRTTVTVWDGEEQHVRDVVTGVRGDQHTEIVSGVEEGDEVVLPTRGSGQLPDIFGPGGGGEPATEPARGANGG